MRGSWPVVAPLGQAQRKRELCVDVLGSWPVVAPLGQAQRKRELCVDAPVAGQLSLHWGKPDRCGSNAGLSETRIEPPARLFHLALQRLKNTSAA